MRDSFILYTSYAAKMDKLNDEQFGKVMRAVFDYQRTGEEPVFDDLLLDVCFSFIKEDLDANNEKYEKVCERRAEAGKQGGRPKKANASDEKQKKQMVFEESKKSKRFSEKAKKADNDNDNDNDNELKEKEIPNGISKKKKKKDGKMVRHKYGKYKNVLLDDDQYRQLKELFPNDYEKRIEDLSFGIEMKGYKYSNFLLAIIRWSERDNDKPPDKGSPRINRSFRGGQDDDDLYTDDIYEVF